MEQLAKRTPETEQPVLDEAAAAQQLSAWVNEQTRGEFAEAPDGPSEADMERLLAGLRSLGSTGTAGSVESPGYTPATAQTPAA